MSILAILIPSRARLRSQSSAAPAGAGEGARVGIEFTYALSDDGLTISSQGRCAAALLPKADSVVAVLSDCDVSWHHITLPKAPAARMRAALVGLLEEALLDEADMVHLAVEPQATPGEPAWVAAVNKPWLVAELAVLESADISVERVLPSSWPDDPPSAHFFEAEEDGGARADNLMLAWSDSQGVACMRLEGGFARAQLPSTPDKPLRASATPAVASAAERWLGAPVVVLPAAQRALLSARSLWNLRQFDLTLRHRGMRALSDVWRNFMSPSWRPVRTGMVALVALQIVGFNLWAWHLRGVMADKQKAMAALLQATYPRASTALPPNVEMERQTGVLRTSAGRASDSDLEALLQAAASAWPAGRPPVDGFRFEPGRLMLSSSGWDATQIERFRQDLRSGGWSLETVDDRMTITRASGGAL